MEKIKVMCWTLKLTITLHPIRTIANFIVTIVSSIIPIYLAVYIGNTVNSISVLLNTPDINLFSFISTLIVLGSFLILNTFLFYGSGIITSALNIKITTHINEKLASTIRNIPIQYFDDTKFCDRFSIAQEGFDNIVSTSDNILAFVGEIVSFAMAIIVITRTSSYLTVFVLVSFLIGFRLNMWSKKIQHNYWVDTTKQRRLSSYISGLFFSRSTAKEIRTFRMLDFIFDKWFSINEQLRDESYDIKRKSNNFFAYYQLFMDISNIVVLVVAVTLAQSGKISIGAIITIWQLNKNILLSVQTINSSYSDLYYNNEKVAEAKCFLTEFQNKQLHDSSLDKNHSSHNEISKTCDLCDKAFEIKNVSFSYIEGTDVLNNINLTIRKGETIAICGANGCGKSTLIKLMLGLYSPNKGEVYVCGRKATDLDAGNFGVAFQDYVCFPFTFRENVGFGFLDEINDNSAIEVASDQGGAIGILKKYGVDKLLTKTMDDGGTELSGGEWQRIALSRANMGQKPLMVFDEPSAKLDPLAEFNQYSQIQGIMQGRTAILVSHRIGFARLAKRIIVMKDGEIIEDGTHDSLIKMNGEYKKMLDEQAQWYDTTWEELK